MDRYLYHELKKKTISELNEFYNNVIEKRYQDFN